MPYRGEDLQRFLHVARAVLLGSVWTEESLKNELCSAWATREAHCFAEQAESVLRQMDKLGITRLLSDGSHEVIMAPQEFKNTFGVKLLN